MKPTKHRFVVLQHFQSLDQLPESRRKWLHGAGQGGSAPELAAGSHGLPSHFDFMLETSPDETLVTFALGSMFQKGEQRPALRLENHRRMYLDYEGPISGDRGHVQRVMQGSWHWRSDSQRETGSRRDDTEASSFDADAEILLVSESGEEMEIVFELIDPDSPSRYRIGIH